LQLKADLSLERQSDTVPSSAQFVLLDFTFPEERKRIVSEYSQLSLSPFDYSYEPIFSQVFLSYVSIPLELRSP